METILGWLLGRPELVGWAITAYVGYRVGGLKRAIDDLIHCHERNEQTLTNHGEDIAVLKAQVRGLEDARFP